MRHFKAYTDNSFNVMASSLLAMRDGNDAMPVRATNMVKALGHVRKAISKGIADDARMEWHELKMQLSMDTINAALAGTVWERGGEVIEKIEQNIQSIIMVVPKKHLRRIKGKEDLIRISSKPLYQRKLASSLTICKDGKYAMQHSAKSLGTGFFVKPDVIATAAHVVIGNLHGVNIKDLRFIHGIVMQNTGDYENGIVVSKKQIFKPKFDTLSSDLYQLTSMGPDWGLIAVEQAYPESGKNNNIVPTSLHLGEIPSGTPLYSLGHGLGLPLKVSYEGEVIQNDRQKTYFECSLTVLGGNSGSPVFHAITHEVVGIYVRGTRKLQMSGACLIVKNEYTHWEGQECQKLDPLLSMIKNI